MIVMKKENDGEHPVSHYLVVEDPQSPSTWHLRIKNKSGEYDRGLCGSAWAALHSNFRGQGYSGPNKAKAISRLTSIYKSQNWPIPSKSTYTESRYGLPDEIGGDSPENDKWMEGCVQKVMGQGKEKSNAIAICKSTLIKTKGNKSKAEFIIDTNLSGSLSDGK